VERAASCNWTDITFRRKYLLRIIDDRVRCQSCRVDEVTRKLTRPVADGSRFEQVMAPPIAVDGTLVSIKSSRNKTWHRRSSRTGAF
jgi:Flp pilus assembly CpaF family ATPase